MIISQLKTKDDVLNIKLYSKKDAIFKFYFNFFD